MFKGRSARGEKPTVKPASFRQNYFGECHRTYSCIHCRAHLANHDELISKLFQGNHGRAYLFNKVVNVGCRQAVQRELLTGLHAVADIYCDSCETTLGWKYEQAFVPSQKYKEGKYIIELVHILKENNWDLTSYNARQLLDEAEAATRRKLSAANNRYAFGCGSGSPRTPVRKPCSGSSVELAGRSLAGLRLAPDAAPAPAESVPGSPCSQSDASSMLGSSGTTPPPADALEPSCSALASH